MHNKRNEWKIQVEKGSTTHISRLAVLLQQLGGIELGSLEDLHLADKHILDGEDTLSSLLDLLPNNLRRELANQALDVDIRRLPGHDLEHLRPDRADLRSLRISRLSDLVRPPLGERDGEQADEVPVGGLDVDVRLDEGLPFADERTEFVGGEVHAVEGEECVLALDFIDSELDLAERGVFLLAEVSDGEFDDTPTDGVSRVLCWESEEVRIMVIIATSQLGSSGENED